MKNLIKLKKVLSKSYIKALSQLVTILTESNLSIETVVLIGSPMHSKTIINSDLDVCIYIQKIDF